MKIGKIFKVYRIAAFLLAIVISVLSGRAEPVSPDLAARAVNGMIAQEGQMESPIKGQVSSVRLCTATNGAAFYVAKLAGGGFVVTSTDTEIDPIIAFSPAPDLVEDPRNPLWALLVADMATRQKSVAAKSTKRSKLMSGKTSASPAAARWASLTASGDGLGTRGTSRDSSSLDRGPVVYSLSMGMKKISDVRVAPLLKTKWGQSTDASKKNCYNYYTPRHYVCGCTATAGAQILRYHKFPKEAVEPRTYECAIDGYYEELTQKGGVYAWDNMPYVPGKGTTDSQRKAIGKLTYDVSLAVGSKYSKNLTDGEPYDFISLCNDWGYAHAKMYDLYNISEYAEDEHADEYGDEYDDYYDDEYEYGFTETQLKSVLIPNLDANLPVGASIDSWEGSHAVVADGYGYWWDEQLCVHFNLGWDGSYDAWYVVPGDITIWYTKGIIRLWGNIYPEGPSEGGIVSGRVLSSSTSGPVADIVVTATNSCGKVYRTKTNAKGIYAFILPEEEEAWDICLENAWPSSYSRQVRDCKNYYDQDFEVDLYTVNFDANGGSGGIASRQSNVVGTLPPAARRGYTLKGWFTAKDGGTEVTASTWTSDDMICYAQWEPNGYRVVFDPNGGSGDMAPMEFAYDEAQTLRPNAFSKAGASFRGWSLSPDKTVLFADGESVKNLLAVPGTVTLYAVWADEKAVVADVGMYFRKTLAELGYNVPTDGQTPYEVKAYGLPAGLALKSNPAVKDKKGKIVQKAKCEWWIEGVLTATLDFATNPPYLVITVDGEATPEPLALESLQKVTELGELALGTSINTHGWLAGVGAGWSVSGLPTGLSFATKKVTKKSGKTTVTVAEAYSVYGKTTKSGLFTITAKKKNGAYYETKKFRVLVTPANVDAARFGDSLADMTTMAYVPFEWHLTNDVSAVGVKVAKIAGLPAGLSFAAADTYAYANPKKKTGKYLKQRGQTIVGTPTKAGTYVVTFTKNETTGTGKKKKTVAKTAQILWVVEPNDAELALHFNTAGGAIEGGTVGLNYGDLMAFTATEGATVTASGMPSGISLADLGGGQWGFTGFTTKSGTYLVTVTAMLNGKAVTQRVLLKVDGLPDWAKGTFNGAVYATGGTPVAPVGLATVTVGSTGKISGKFYEGGTNWTFGAASYLAFDGTDYSVPVTAKYAYKVKSGKKTVTAYVERTFQFAVSSVPVVPDVSDAPFRGVVRMEEGDEACVIQAYQNLWGQTDYQALGKKLFTSKSGKKTLAYKTFTVDGASDEGAAIGLTEAMTLSLKVTTAGAVTATLAYDTGTTKKDPKTKKAVKVIYKTTCQTVVIPTSSADADPFTGMLPLYFAPSKGTFDGWSGNLTATFATEGPNWAAGD